MAKQRASVDYNNFVAGLNTDASPLTFPKNSSLDEVNFVLNDDGSRHRRLGMDYEKYHQIRPAFNSHINNSSNFVPFNTYVWEDAGGITGNDLLVVQTGVEISIYRLIDGNMTGNRLSTHYFDYSVTFDDIGNFNNKRQVFSFTSVQGYLVVANGTPYIAVFEYDDSSLITRKQIRLQVRDHFGVEAKDGGIDLRSGNGISVRETAPNYATWIYNLRNQSFGIPRIDANTENLSDPLITFRTAHPQNALPSHSDTVSSALYADTSDADNRTVRRFFAEDLYNNPVGSSHAPNGHFIIDLLERGPYRSSAISAMKSKYPVLNTDPTLSPAFNGDRTPGGATCVGTYYGHVFYGGFSSAVADGDEYSPNMGSMVFFSKLVNKLADLTVCHQQADPTDSDDPDIVDTDGGYVAISGADRILSLNQLGSSLIVMASNGVWSISGGNDTGFSATGYIVTKISDAGCISPSSVVETDNGILYWSDRGIYSISGDERGQLVAQSVSKNVIQTLYESIPTEDKEFAAGVYDSYNDRVRWIYYTNVTNDNDVHELVLDLGLKAFYKNVIPSISSGPTKVVSVFDAKSEGGINYLIVTKRRSGSVDMEYTVGSYRDKTFTDFPSEGGGEDAAAFLVTGYESHEEFQRRKQVNKLTTKFLRTEDGFDGAGNNITGASNASSCIVQARWAWNNSAAGGKWGREFQAYRYRKHYMADNIFDTYDTGDLIIDTKHKIRGHGKTVSFLFKTEPLKDCKILGWSMITTVNSDT